jgi:hypothetical protein
MMKDSPYLKLFGLDNKILEDIFLDQKSFLGSKFHFCRVKDKLKLLDRNDPQGN